MEFDNKVRKHAVGNPTRSCDAGAVLGCVGIRNPWFFGWFFQSLPKPIPSSEPNGCPEFHVFFC